MPAPCITVRMAQPGDAAAIARMIRALARAEGTTSRMGAASVRTHGFGPGAHFSLLIAETDPAQGEGVAQALGYALFFPFFDTDDGRPGNFLADLYVVPAARGRGVGRALMAELGAVTEATGRHFMVWTVRTDNAPALRLYRRLGALAGTQEVHFIDGSALQRLAERSRTRSSRPRGRGRPGT
jgi:ribosomal protein S18 acetylase RimI-like enzyme